LGTACKSVVAGGAKAESGRPRSRSRNCRRQTYHGRCWKAPPASGSLEKLRALWRQAPTALREEDEEFLIGYATRAVRLTASRSKMPKRCCARPSTGAGAIKLVVGYGMLERGNAAAQLATAEGWLARHER
jgi:uncharacterized protein HemY